MEVPYDLLLPMRVLHGLQGDNLHHHAPLHGLQKGPCSDARSTSSSFSHLAGLFLTFFVTPLSHSCCAVFCPFLHRLSQRCHHFAHGAQPCTAMGGLEPTRTAVSGMGQPRQLLTGAALQPPLSVPAHLHLVQHL